MRFTLIIVFWCLVCVVAADEKSKRSFQLKFNYTRPSFYAYLEGMGHGICSGSVVHQRFILTSASCVHSINPTFAFIGPKMDYFTVDSIITHPTSNLIKRSDNIALVKTNSNIESSPIGLSKSEIHDNSSIKYVYTKRDDLGVSHELFLENLNMSNTLSK